MGIGVVSYFSSPINLPPSLRLLRTLRVFSRMDKTYLFTSSMPVKGVKIDRLLNVEMPDAVEIIRIFSPTIYNTFSFLGKRISSALENRVPFYIDTTYYWLPFLYKSICNYIDKGLIDKLFFSVSPFSSLLVIPQIKRKYPSLKIIVEFRDPWINNVYNPHYNKYSQLSKRIMDYVDVIVGSSRDISDLLKEIYKRDVITLYSAEYTPSFLYKNIKMKHPAILYTGRFYGYRRIEPVLRLFDRKWSRGEDFFFYIIGGISHVNNEEKRLLNKWKERIFIMPMMEWHRSMSFVKEADALLIVNGNIKGGEIFIPAKFYDYLFAKKPMILFDNGGELSEIMEMYNLGISVYYNKDSDYKLDTVWSLKPSLKIFNVDSMVKVVEEII